MTLAIAPELRVGGLLWLPEGPGPWPGLLVAHGHFGEGKSSAEVQDPANAFASQGYAVLAVDTVGVEEGDLPGRRIHGPQGAHGRGLLIAAGSSALALQVRGLQAGLDLLESLGAGPIAVTGASEGAVQAFALLLADPRPVAAALAAYVPMPRAAWDDACACDLVPGWPGPDPALAAAAARPVLWMADRQAEAPAGGSFLAFPGPHSYTREMISAALHFLAPHTGGGREMPATLPDPVKRRRGPLGSATLADLFPEGPPIPAPRPATPLPFTLECAGQGPGHEKEGRREPARLGPTLILAGGAAGPDGARGCSIHLDFPPAETARAQARGEVPADTIAATLAAAAKAEGAVGVVGRGAWAVAAARSGLPYAVEAPPRDPLALTEADPDWVHVPGWWWAPDPYAQALPVEALLIPFD